MRIEPDANPVEDDDSGIRIALRMARNISPAAGVVWIGKAE
jgi:hypothetical protein